MLELTENIHTCTYTCEYWHLRESNLKKLGTSLVLKARYGITIRDFFAN